MPPRRRSPRNCRGRRLKSFCKVPRRKDLRPYDEQEGPWLFREFFFFRGWNNYVLPSYFLGDFFFHKPWSKDPVINQCSISWKVRDPGFFFRSSYEWSSHLVCSLSLGINFSSTHSLALAQIRLVRPSECALHWHYTACRAVENHSQTLGVWHHIVVLVSSQYCPPIGHKGHPMRHLCKV